MNRVYKVWSIKELNFLKDNYLKMSRKELAAKLNRKIPCIAQQMRILKIKQGKRFEWSANEIDYLRANLHKSRHQLAEDLNRPYGSVCKKYNELNLNQ